MLRGEKEALLKKIGIKKGLLRFLRSNDILMFDDNGERGYLFVERVDDERVYGDYIYDSGKMEKRDILFDEIASRDFSVAYLQKVLATQ